MKEYIDGNYNVKEYENGTIIRTLMNTETEIPIPIPQRNEIEEIKQNQLIIMEAIADLYTALPITTV